MEKRPTGKGGKDLRKEKGEALRGGKALGGKGERGETILGRKRDKIWKGLKGKGGKDLNRERRQRILRRNREKISAGGKAVGGKGGKNLNRERGGKISGRKGKRSQGGGKVGEREEKGEDLRVEKALGGKGGKGS